MNHNGIKSSFHCLDMRWWKGTNFLFHCFNNKWGKLNKFLIIIKNEF